jgi:hypothetical protein
VSTATATTARRCRKQLQHAAAARRSRTLQPHAAGAERRRCWRRWPSGQHPRRRLTCNMAAAGAMQSDLPGHARRSVCSGSQAATLPSALSADSLVRRYGPGMHPYDGRVTSNFLVQAINNEDITVYGEGNQTRSFCYVDDLIDGLIRLMNQEETIGPVNIGNPTEFTIKQLAELAIKTTGSKSKIIYQPLPGDDPKQRRPDISKAKKFLKWEPKIPLEEGIVKAAEYFRSLDLSRFKKPTKHTAHKNTLDLEDEKAKANKRQKH